MSATLEVVLPSASSFFQSTLSGVTCTGRSTCQLPLFLEATRVEFSRRELEYTVGFDREEITVEENSSYQVYRYTRREGLGIAVYGRGLK